MAVVQPSHTGHPGCNVVLPRDLRTAAEARFMAGAALSAWGLEAESGRARAVVSKLVTNAVKHAYGPMVRVIVERPAYDRVYLSVADRAPNDLPRRQEPAARALEGWGLVVADALADRVGVRPARTRGTSSERIHVGGTDAKPEE
ncbi:ATP-binding protein [Streptomyces sp. NPDC058195]|uniref:ATP-binding protein n=1 Tax=Streptomyces sp. NPDC058195 TaxID=3346375 RepID=UPI0036E39B75